MARVRAVTRLIVGPGQVAEPGTAADVPDAVAERFIRLGAAEPAEPAEPAKKPAPRRAAPRRKKPA